MRYIRLIFITLFSFITVTNEGFIRRCISAFLCSIFSVNATVCNSYLMGDSRVNATVPLTSSNNSLIQVLKNRVESESKLFNPFAKIPQIVVQIPRIRQQTHPSSERDAPETGNFPPVVKPSHQNRTNTVPHKYQTIANNSPLFTPLFKRLSDDTMQIELKSNEGCNFIIKLKRKNHLVYQESVQFISSSLEICKSEPFMAHFSPDGKIIELKDSLTHEYFKFEQVSESFIKRTFGTSSGQIITDTIEIPRNFREILRQQPKAAQPQAFQNQKSLQKLENDSSFNSSNSSEHNSQSSKYGFSSSCLAAEIGNNVCDAISIISGVNGGNLLSTKFLAKFAAKGLFRLSLVGWITNVLCYSAYGGLIPPFFASLNAFEKSNIYWLEKRGSARLAEFIKQYPLMEKTSKYASRASAFITGLEDILNIKMPEWLENFKVSGVLNDFLDKCNHDSTSEQSIARSGKEVKGTSYGDPHLITFDGYKYSFQTVGEFILAKSTDGLFEVQTRQSAVNRSLSLNSAVAMRVGKNRVAFYSKDFPDSDSSTPLRINGKSTVVQGNSLSLRGGGIIHKKDDSNYVVEWSTGEKVALTIYSRGQFKYMDVFPFVFESQAGKIVGLLGNVNGDANDDLRFRNGNILPSKSTYGDVNQLINRVSPIRLPLGELEKMYFNKLNKDFGNSWRVSQEESLFDYASGKFTKTFTDKAFPDAYLTLDMLSPTQLQEARTKCLNAKVEGNLLDGCIFDVGFTGYSEFAYRAAQVSNILDIIKSTIPGFKNPVPEIIRHIPKIPGLPF